MSLEASMSVVAILHVQLLSDFYLKVNRTVMNRLYSPESVHEIATRSYHFTD